MLDQILAVIKKERAWHASQLALISSGTLKMSELRDGRWVDICGEVGEALKRKIFEADDILARAGRGSAT